MIKSYEQRYEKQVLHLLENYHMNWADSAIETALAFDEEKVIGIGSLSKNAMHPNREYINIYVQPKKRRKGIGMLIFKELFSLSESKKFQAATSSKNTSTVSFLEKYGFNIARKCYTPELKKNHVIINLDYKKNFKTFERLSSKQEEETFKLQMKNYRQFHEAINPLSEAISYTRWKEIISEELCQKHSYVMLNAGAVEAYIFSYKSEDSDSIEIGYIGGKDVNKLNGYLDFYKQVLNHLFEEFHTIEIEADDVDPFAYGLINEFEYDKTESWDAYIFDKA